MYNLIWCWYANFVKCNFAEKIQSNILPEMKGKHVSTYNFFKMGLFYTMYLHLGDIYLLI